MSPTTMAVVVNNTFLDVPEHKFLCFDEPCCVARRCHSVPRTWKPAPHSVIPYIRSKRRTISLASSSSTQSDLSSCPSVESLEALSPSEDNSVRTPSEDKNETCIATDMGATGIRTRLKGAAPAFQPIMQTESRLDAVTNAVYLALVSCGQTCHIKIEKGVGGVSPTLLTAELQNGPRSCYDAIHLARQALEAITTRLDSVALLSKRVQKEDRGYSLRSSVACIPSGAQNSMCWDFFNKGNCPRRCKCQWYHPQGSDIERFKVVIKSPDDATEVFNEEQLPTGYSAVKQRISLGDLVH